MREDNSRKPAVSTEPARDADTVSGATESTGQPRRKVTAGVRRLRSVLLSLLVLAAAVAVFDRMMATRETVLSEPPGERVWAVEATTVALATTRARIALFGQIVAGRQVDLRPLVAGRIVRIGSGFREGGYVAEGALLVSVDPFDYETARALRAADLAGARAGLSEIEADLSGAREQLVQERRQLELLDRNVRRLRQLNRRGAAPERRVDDAELALSGKKQAISERRNAVERLAARAERQQAAIRRAETVLDRAERDLSRTRLTSPFGGWLVDIGADIGKQVGTGERVARLIDASGLEAKFLIPNRVFDELDMRGGLIGRKLTVIWRTGGTARSFPAKIVRQEGEIDAASGGVSAFARIGRLPAATRLRAGAFVELILEGPELTEVVRLPRAAVYGGGTVYRVTAADRLEAVQVTVRAMEGDSLLVQGGGGGLEDGQRVVLTRFPEIAPGVKVTVP